MPRGYPVQRNGGRKPAHAHRANYTKVVDGNTVREGCYCGVVRYVQEDADSTRIVGPWFYKEREPRDVAQLPGKDIARLHRQLLLAASLYGSACSSGRPSSDIADTALDLERAAARWAIALGKVGRAAKARP
jgi:hypothetical protein